MIDDRTDPQYKLRWPESLRDRIAAMAKHNKRSLNAEIIARLEASLEGSQPTSNLILDREGVLKATEAFAEAARMSFELGRGATMHFTFDGPPEDHTPTEADERQIAQRESKNR